MNDIEAAEREAFAKYITSQEHIGFDAVVWRGIGGDPLGVLHEPEYSENSLRSEWAAWLARSALAHAARGEPVRSWRDVEGTLPARRDGDKVARVDEMVPWFLAPTPPPATGEAGRRSASIDALRRIARAAKPFAFYARSLTGVPGEYLMRVPKDEADEIQRAVDAIWGTDDYATPPTPPPATGEAERCEDHGREGCIDCEPATGEAGTRGEVERVRAAVIDAAKAFRAHDETYLIANYENVAEEGERQRLIVKMLVAVDALLAAERSENGGDRG